MIRKLMLLSAILISFSLASRAQMCGVDLATQQLLKEHPELAAKIAANHQLLEAQIAAIMKRKSADMSRLAKTTGTADTLGVDTFIIPVVVHVIHNYGTEDVTDAQINTMMQNLNIYYNARNTDITGVIPTFKPYIGDMRIGFHLATKDPQGNPTRGVTRRLSYLTNGGDNYAKFDLWDPSSYLNIWTESFIGLGAEVPGSIVAAYSQLPDVGAADPFIDGLITGAPFIADATTAYVISHEVGHYLGLLHPFGNNNVGCPQPALADMGCGDDGVDDTPPTTGEFCVSCVVGLYDTLCATGYKKTYVVDSVVAMDSIIVDSVTHANDTINYTVTYTKDSVYDYPDTANTQNIMTYSQCDPELMFTKGQTYLVQATLRTTLANRNDLSTLNNLYTTGVLADTVTGALAPLPILPPVADFSVNNHFVCEGTNTTEQVTFTNHSWNDTVKSVTWTLPSYASVPTSTNVNGFTSTFSQPGWVKISLVANGSGTSGSDTLTDSTTLYVADPVATPVSGYFQEFNPAVNNDLNKYPMFNYYNNEFKWMLNTNTGYYDNSCIEYTGFDYRTYPANSVGIPKGDYDDLYTPAFDLTSLQGGEATPSLNFMYSAAALTSTAGDINDTLEIDYNTGCGLLWTPLAYLSKGTLVNQGGSSIPYRPLWMGAWSLQSIPLVNGSKSAISSSTIFRFRYKPGVNLTFYTKTGNGYSTGNNFYMDRMNFSNYTAGLNTLIPNDKSIVVTPNPTNGDAFVLISSKNDVTAQIMVTDIAGRVVYTTAQQTTGSITRVTIPRSAITATGMYLVHVVAGDQNQTDKLVVY